MAAIVKTLKAQAPLKSANEFQPGDYVYYRASTGVLDEAVVLPCFGGGVERRAMRLSDGYFYVVGTLFSAIPKGTELTLTIL